MIEIVKDIKTKDSFIITKTDSEGLHRQLNITRSEMDSIIAQYETLYPY